MITDEIILKAARFRYEYHAKKGNSDFKWDDLPEPFKTNTLTAERDCLEAILPDLTAAARAEGMEEAVSLWDEWYRGKSSGGVHILKRAREIRSSLAPKATGEG